MSRPVSVEVGQTAAPEGRRAPPPACIVAVAPLEGPWLSDVVPEALVRQTRYETQSVGVEQLRFESRSVVERLPGLEGPYGPTLLRDAVDQVLTTGTNSIDVLVARVEGAKATDFDDERARDALDGYLADMPGALLLYPDFTGPAQITPGPGPDPNERADRIARSLELHQVGWRERYQIALLDDPQLPDDEMRWLLDSLLGTDTAVCRWTGSEDARRAHAWRPASAAVAGMLEATDRAILGMVGHGTRLAEGRRIAASRRERLSLTDPGHDEPDYAQYFLSVDIDSKRGRANITSEPTFRRPMGAWPFSALRMAKAVHQRLVEASSRFVFQPANPRLAMALAAALEHAMRPFVDAGLLVGPSDADQPVVVGTVDRDASGVHSLLADVTGTLRPWSRRVAVRVSLRPNESPTLEVL